MRDTPPRFENERLPLAFDSSFYFVDIMKLNPTTHQTDPRTDHTPLCLSPVLARELGDGLLERRERDVGRGAPHLGSVAAEVRGVELRARLRQRVEVLRGRERLGRRQAHEGGRQQQVVRDGAHEEGGEEVRRLRVRRRGRGWGAAEGGEEARRSAAVRRLRVVEGEVVDAVQQDLEPAGELHARKCWPKRNESSCEISSRS